jgi:hypothetical protein
VSAIVGIDRSVTGALSAEKGFYRLGEVVAGRYIVRELIGTGPLGVVYRTENQESGAVVALRAVWADLLPDDAARGRFLKEAIRARTVQNRYVAPLYEAFIDEVEGRTLCILAIKHLSGPTLASRVARRLRHDVPLLAVEAQPIVSQIGVGLSAIHGLGLVHGNLRAANIYLAGEEIRIADLGLASALPPDVVALAEANAGKNAGRAPEAAAGRACSPASDVYAFAVLTAQMLGLLSPRSREEVPVPSSVRAVLRRALSQNPRDRYGDVDTFAGALVTAFERIDQRTSLGLRAVAPTGDLTPRIRTMRPVRNARPDSSDVVTGALESSPKDSSTKDGGAKDQRSTPGAGVPAASVVLDPDALYSETPATLPPMTRAPIPLRKIRQTGAYVAAAPAQPAPAIPRRIPHAPPAPSTMALARTTPAVTMDVVRPRAARERPPARVPFALVLLLTVATTSLAAGVVRNIVAGSFEERMAEERVAKAELLRQLSGDPTPPPPTE